MEKEESQGTVTKRSGDERQRKHVSAQGTGMHCGISAIGNGPLSKSLSKISFPFGSLLAFLLAAASPFCPSLPAAAPFAVDEAAEAFLDMMSKETLLLCEQSTSEESPCGFGCSRRRST